eukprot:c19342_g1_i1.p1 GENE.c19342_g1_i1~~c19342_g1_i1.p1  ORF type:complete len:164 (-),score=56.66 c19342_g1_i1:37-507(-)
MVSSKRELFEMSPKNLRETLSGAGLLSRGSKTTLIKRAIIRYNLQPATPSASIFQTNFAAFQPAAAVVPSFSSAPVIKPARVAPSDCTFQVEKAKSGRSTCKGCYQKIGNGEMRAGPEIYNEDIGHATTNWYHKDCFVNSFGTTVLTAAQKKMLGV